MVENVFSPIFGGRPDCFFGRKEMLDRFDLAMTDHGSEDRVVFLTGARGSGKTALLEQFSARAKSARRTVIDLGPEDTIAQLIQVLVPHDEATATTAPQASINILGTGGSLSVGAVSKTTRYGRERLQDLLLDACKRTRNGLLLTIDEVQKVPVEDVSALCNAFQMASRKGYDIMLAVAGLPYAHDKIIQHDGCTYLRRASHEELGLFSWDEANEALREAFGRIADLRVADELLDRMNETSYGHPYLMQLLGYHLVAYVNKANHGDSHEVTASELDAAVPRAMLAFERRALKPMVDELSATGREYLRAMSTCLNADRLAATSDIARALGKDQKNLSRDRQWLIDLGIIAAPERGKVMFCIPYLARYVQKDERLSSPVAIARQRGV